MWSLARGCLLITAIVCVNCEFSDILKLCENETCQISETKLLQLNATADHRKRMFKLISAGVPQILWEKVADMREKNVHIGKTFAISDHCADSLVKVSSGLDELYEWALRLIDSSGKTPAALFESTITSIGDYNECLDIHTPDFDGQYCMPDLFPLKTKAQQATWPGPSRKERAATGRLNLGDIAVFKGMSFNFGLCIPSTCEAEEVRNVLSHVLEPYLLKPAGALSCDTKKSISFETRFSKLTKHQVAAMWLIGSILGIVGLITSLHFLLMALNYRQSGNFLVTLPPFLSAISMVDNVLQLVKPSDRGARSTVVDMTKFIVVMFGVLAHIVVCLEIPISYYAFSSHTFLNNAFGDPNNQAILADSGLNIITFLGGVTSYSIMVPMARNKKLPFLFAIFDRWVRFVPSILVITAIEFIWPVLWSGPIFTRVADFTLKKCTENWWTNILFINNWYPVVDVCAGHTYSASVDFQLFILGLIATYITVRSVKAGLIYSVAMMVYGWLHIAYNAYKYETTGTLYVPDPIPINIVNYMDYIHMSTAIYIPAYFMGFIAGHYLAAGYRLKVDTVKDHIIWNIVAQLFFGVVIVQNGLYNGLRVIPHSWSPMQININRTMHTLGGAVSFVYYSSLNHIFGYKLQNYGDDSVQEKSTSKFDLVSTMCRLSYSIYLSNYILIKSEFFGQKVLFPADWYHVLKRLFATALMIIMFAFVFQVLFIAPFNNIRRLLFDRKPVPKETKKVD